MKNEFGRNTWGRKGVVSTYAGAKASLRTAWRRSAAWVRECSISEFGTANRVIRMNEGQTSICGDGMSLNVQLFTIF